MWSYSLCSCNECCWWFSHKSPYYVQFVYIGHYPVLYILTVYRKQMVSQLSLVICSAIMWAQHSFCLMWHSRQGTRHLPVCYQDNTSSETIRTAVLATVWVALWGKISSCTTEKTTTRRNSRTLSVLTKEYHNSISNALVLWPSSGIYLRYMLYHVQQKIYWLLFPPPTLSRVFQSTLNCTIK